MRRRQSTVVHRFSGDGRDGHRRGQHWSAAKAGGRGCSEAKPRKVTSSSDFRDGERRRFSLPPRGGWVLLLRNERARLTLLICVALLLASPRPAVAQRFATNGPYNHPAGKSPTAEVLRDIRIEQRLEAPLPLHARFRDETGRAVALGDYIR